MIESVYMNGNLADLDEGSKESGVDVTISIDQEPDERICRNCSEAIVEYPSGWVHEQGSRGAIGDPDLCGSIDWMDIAIAVDVDPDEAPEGFTDIRNYSIDQLRDVGYTKAEPRDVAASIGSANWVSAEVSPDSVSASISIGDPRGAVVMRLWRGDQGRIYLSVPHPDDSTPHVNLVPHGQGVYRVE